MHPGAFFFVYIKNSTTFATEIQTTKSVYKSIDMTTNEEVGLKLRESYLPKGTKLTLKHNINDDQFYSNMEIIKHHKDGIDILITNNLFCTPLPLTLHIKNFKIKGSEFTFKVQESKYVTYIIKN